MKHTIDFYKEAIQTALNHISFILLFDNKEVSPPEFYFESDDVKLEFKLCYYDKNNCTFNTIFEFDFKPMYNPKEISERDLERFYSDCFHRVISWISFGKYSDKTLTYFLELKHEDYGE